MSDPRTGAVQFEFLHSIAGEMFSSTREAVRVSLEAAGVAEPALSDAVLIAHELLSNAAVHGRPPTCLTIKTHPDSVTIEVTDHGADLEWPPDSSTGTPRTHGLELIAAFASARGVERSGASKTVWARIQR